MLSFWIRWSLMRLLTWHQEKMGRCVWSAREKRQLWGCAAVFPANKVALGKSFELFAAKAASKAIFYPSRSGVCARRTVGGRFGGRVGIEKMEQRESLFADGGGRVVQVRVGGALKEQDWKNVMAAFRRILDGARGGVNPWDCRRIRVKNFTMFLFKRCWRILDGAFRRILDGARGGVNPSDCRQIRVKNFTMYFFKRCWKVKGLRIFRRTRTARRRWWSDGTACIACLTPATRLSTWINCPCCGGTMSLPIKAPGWLPIEWCGPTSGRSGITCTAIDCDKERVPSSRWGIGCDSARNRALSRRCICPDGRRKCSSSKMCAVVQFLRTRYKSGMAPSSREHSTARNCKRSMYRMMVCFGLKRCCRSGGSERVGPLEGVAQQVRQLDSQEWATKTIRGFCNTTLDKPGWAKERFLRVFCWASTISEKFRPNAATVSKRVCLFRFPKTRKIGKWNWRPCWFRQWKRRTEECRR